MDGVGIGVGSNVLELRDLWFINLSMQRNKIMIISASLATIFIHLGIAALC